MERNDPMPPAHDLHLDKESSQGCYLHSGTDIRFQRLAEGHAHLAMAAVAFCGCYRTTDAYCGNVALAVPSRYGYDGSAA